MTRSLLKDIKPNSFNGTDSAKGGAGETAKRGTGMATVRGVEARQTQTYRAEGIRGMMGEKGLQEGDWTDRNNWRKIT
jgi:hypothetical protein